MSGRAPQRRPARINSQPGTGTGRGSIVHVTDGVPEDLEAAIRAAWALDTCDPVDADDWSSGGPPADDPALAAWLPVRAGLTPHGFRHSHKTWMIEDRIPEILAETRLGHEVPGMRGLYSHVSDQMWQELKDKLQARWEESLKARHALAPYSPVPTLNELLTSFCGQSGRIGNLSSQIPPRSDSNTAPRVA
jgi:hypothetical protein